jgi:hypothetical protein
MVHHQIKEVKEMISRKGKRLIILVSIMIVTAFLIVHYPSPAFFAQDSTSSKPEPTGNIWYELFSRGPYPYTIALPPPYATIIDGTYTKFETKKTPPIPCRRCPDYLWEGRIWKLNLTKGVFRIFHEVTGWRSIGTYIVNVDFDSNPPTGQLLLANDPVCQETLGLYHWKLEEGKLILTVVEDPCSMRLRALNLTHLPWLSCQAPCREAAVTDHWIKPAGCDN